MLKHKVMRFIPHFPIPGGTIKSGPYKGRGDGYDQFSHCTVCNRIVSRDTNMFGDAKWRHQWDMK